MSNYYVVMSQDYLEHHGILGMKWGVRRYQNADGSLTAEGRKHYGVRAKLENATSDRERRLILTKETNKVNKMVALSGPAYVAGIAATAGIAVATSFSTPLALIPAGVGLANALGTPVYAFFKNMKLSELAAEFDVSTNVTRSISNDDKANRSSSGPRYTPEQQRERLSAARNNGTYDVDFLEFMQNTKVSYDNNETALNNAYKEYLKDPEAFATDPDFYKKYPYA